MKHYKKYKHSKTEDYIITDNDTEILLYRNYPHRGFYKPINKKKLHLPQPAFSI